MSLPSSSGRVAIASITTVLFLAGALPAAAQSISGLSVTNNSSPNTSNSDQDRRSSVQIDSSNSSSFTTRYRYGIGADRGPFQSDLTISITSDYRVNFNVNAPGAYRLDVASRWHGGMTTRSDGAGEANSNVNAMTGSQTGGTLTSGTLSNPDPGRRPDSGDTGSTGDEDWEIFRNAVITGTSNGSNVAHQLRFVWNSSCQSDTDGFANGNGGDECAVRSGRAVGPSSSDAGDYPGVGNRDINQDGHFITVTLTSFCGNGVVDTSVGEQCDGGACCTSSCQFASAATTCRSSGGICDVAETCSGSSASCPANGFVAAGSQCRGSAGLCDVAETCTGSGASCPADGVLSGGTECRGAAGLCDVAEVCDGSSTACPADGVLGSGTECRSASGLCDAAEVCDGSSTACPADGVLGAGTECRGSAGACDVAETCDGSATTCPADGFLSSGTECRASAGSCDSAEVCDGTDAACPADTVSPSGTVCRGATDVCDAAETCDGVSGACPADALIAAPDNDGLGGTASQSSTDGGAANLAVDGNTDGDLGNGSVTQTNAESEAYWDVDLGAVGDIDNIAVWNRTDSASAALSNFYVFVSDDPFSGASVASSTGQAGVDAYFHPGEGGTPSIIHVGRTGRYVRVQLTGSDALTLAEVEILDGTTCRNAADVCDAQELCDGASAACPATDVKQEIECRGATDLCDAAEVCDGAANTCPADDVLASGTECRGTAGLCDVAETCDGSSTACPADGFEASGTLCRGSADLCDVAETCDGGSAACPADSVAAAGTECRATGGVCDVAEACDGSSTACPADGKATAGTSCRASGGVCDLAEVCDGSTNDCPADGKVTAGTECRGIAGVCDVAEACDGSANDCPADGFVAAGTECRGSVDVCDAADSCDGASAACPADAKVPAGTECRGSAGACDVAEACDGSNDACPVDALEPAGTVCRSSIDPQCDFDETCDGSSTGCPIDVTEPDGTVCDDGDAGTVGESCTLGICGCLGPDLDGDTIADVCDPDDAPMSVRKATIWATGNKLGRTIAVGSLFTGQLGTGDVLDTSNGLTATVLDGGDAILVADFAPAECETKNSGLIKCFRRIDSTKKWKVTLKPKKKRGVPTGEWKVKVGLQGFDVDVGIDAPISVVITTGAIDRLGMATACGGGDTRLLCKGP